MDTTKNISKETIIKTMLKDYYKWKTKLEYLQNNSDDYDYTTYVFAKYEQLKIYLTEMGYIE